MRGGAAAAALTLAFLAPAVAADWPADGGSGGRTGALAVPGPARDGVALVLAPPEGSAWHEDAAPLARGREVLAMTDREILAIDIDTGATRTIAQNPPYTWAEPTPEWPGSAWALLDDTIVLAQAARPPFYCADPTGPECEGVSAQLRLIPSMGGTERALPLSEIGLPRACSVAVEPDESAFYVACSLDDPSGFFSGGKVLEVRAFDADGTPRWAWRKEMDGKAAAAPLLQQGGAYPERHLVGVSVVGELVVPIIRTVALRDGTYWDGWVLDKSTGALASGVDLTYFGTEGHFGSSGEMTFYPGTPTLDVPSLVVGDDALWARKERVCCNVPGQPPPLELVIAPSAVDKHAEALGVRLRGTLDTGARIALASERVFAATDTALASFTRAGEPVWDVDLPANVMSLALPLLVDDEQLFVFVATDPAAPTRLLVLDADNGRRLWEHAFDGAVLRLGAGPGVLAALVERADGTVLLEIVGETGASIRFDARASDAYPRAGELVRVELDGLAAGVGGAAVRFRADWGDGELTEWQTSPVLEHGYTSVGDHVAYVFAANDAGQVSSRAIEFHVGRERPQNFLQQQFSSENQERTFFLLGLLITAVFAAFGLLRVRRRRGTLARELAAVERVHEMTRANPMECERALAERRTHARALLVDGRLDDGQFAVLERRIDELARAVRTAGIERELAFLTVGMANALRGMLADGRIERWERDHFLEALARDDHLTPEQKEKVRARIDAWFERDAA